jgi:hypothetical protein
MNVLEPQKEGVAKSLKFTVSVQMFSHVFGIRPPERSARLRQVTYPLFGSVKEHRQH